jgi:hypothetical protein
MLDRLKEGYSPKESFPLMGYAVVTLLFNSLLLPVVAGMAKAEKASEPSSAKPASKPVMDTRDLLLLGVATHKLTRIITKDEITSFIRAPFTRYQESLGYGEVNERPRKSGMLNIVGELLTCNYCMSAWVGLGFFGGMVRLPRHARALAGFFSTLALSDFLHVLYEERRTQANVLTLTEEKMDRQSGRA